MKRLILSFICCLLGSFVQMGYSAEETHASSINELQFQMFYINIYEGGLYESYFAQLKAFAEKELQKNKSLQKALESSPENSTPFIEDGLNLIKKIFKPLPVDSFDKAHYHENFMKQLRILINQKNHLRIDKNPLTKNLIDFINHLTVWMFTSPDLTRSSQNFMYGETGLDKQDVDALFKKDPNNFANALQSFFFESPRFSENEKPPEMLNDPVLYGDMPTLVFQLKNGKKTKVVRTANVAHDHGVNDEISLLNEEFKNYLLASPNKLHLYVNLLPREGDDLDKTVLIEELENDPLVGKSIVIITLPKQKSSNFYFQKEEYADLSDAFLFKQAFFANLFARDGEFYWSIKLDVAKWRKQVLGILDTIHEEFFDAREKLTVEERLDFIEIAYVKFIDALVTKFNPDFMNISCKQSVDRGPSLYVLYYLYDRFKAGSTLKNEVQNLYLLYFSPAIAFHNRPGHDYRIARFQNALNRMLPVLDNKEKLD